MNAARWPDRWRKAILRRWRRSLLARVVTMTLVLTAAVVVLIGVVLLHQVRTGLLDSHRKAAVAEALAGVDRAQSQFAAADRTDATGFRLVAQPLVTELALRGSGSYDVVLLGPTSPSFLTGGAERTSVPASLQSAVQRQGRSAYVYSTLRYADNQAVPGIVVGGPVVFPNVGRFGLYFLFPLREPQATLHLVTRTLLYAGIALIALIALIAALVIRQVVRPVRLARRSAERLSAGLLEERMVVRGEDDLARLATSFNAMADNLQRQIRQLEDLSRVQRQFVADVSHELRTPLTTVRMAADVLHESRAGFPPVVARSAELLQMQLDRFEALLSDLLEISRHDARAVVLDTEPVDLRLLVQQCTEAVDPLAARDGSQLRLHLPPEPVVAEIDARRVGRILRNLLTNAVEHGEGRTIDVRVAGSADAVAVTVRDHGIGLLPGQASLVFNRFWRADPARGRTTGGTGLGLSIALEDTRLHGGWLQAWGAPDDGAQFRLTLPRRAGEPFTTSPLRLAPEDRAAARPAAAAGTPP